MDAIRLCGAGLFVWLVAPLVVSGGARDSSDTRFVAIEWRDLQPAGTIEVVNGRLSSLEIVRGKGRISGDSFESVAGDDVRILASLSGVSVNPGSDPTLVRVKTKRHPFSFLLRDVCKDYPIYIPEYHVVVTSSDDDRTYSQIEKDLHNRHGRTRLQQVESEPEESFESAAAHTRNQPCPVWLGLSRDMRIFQLSDNLAYPSSEMNVIEPRNASMAVTVPEFGNSTIRFDYIVGRGQGVAINTTRRLEEGVLPILHSTLTDGGVEYRATAFVSLEQSPLTARTLTGTDWLVADSCSIGHMFTGKQEELVKPRMEVERTRTETTVLYYRCSAVNTTAVPRYAWFKTVRPILGAWKPVGYSLDRRSGFSSFSQGGVFAVSRLNGRPLHDEEMAVLVQPGDTAVFEFVVPHSPISNERAVALSKQSFDARLSECIAFWKGKLGRAARIQVPERRINEMIQAGLLQLDMITYGAEPGGTLAPAIGIYSPIGTESSPIIQFYSSIGLPDIARRSLMFFLEKQHDDGMIQNFGGYMVETGAALWSMGEYFRYTKDTAWVKQVEPQLLRAAGFLTRWRAENKIPGLKGRGYGMISGKVADPNDPYHQYMLNAYAYLGMSRVAEMLKAADPPASEHVSREAEAWKEDIRASLAESIAKAPVVPLGDGRWSPTVAPWAEATGPRALHVTGESFFSHGTVTTPDVLLGPLYLVFCEVLGAGEQASRMMLDYESELFFERNAAFSQPYYSRHDWLQLKLGLVKPFLKTYYNTLSALADRDTYTFWEHVFQVSQHKTHEQAWFLMQTRWMLYMEQADTLRLLPGVPRRWLEDGNQITLEGVRSYFGPISLAVTSRTATGAVEASIACDSPSRPRVVIIRLPHPEGKRAARVEGGAYDPATESVVISNFAGAAAVRIEY